MPYRQNTVSFLLGLLCLVLVSTFVKAVPVDDLYSAVVAVDNQSPKNQSSGFSQGLKDVLLKVRGNRDVFNHRQIRRAIRSSTPFVKSFSYQSSAGQLYLQVSFDQDKVVALLRDNDFPVWGSRRPDTLIWLAFESEPLAERRVMRPSTHAEFYQQMNAIAEQRGISLLYPIWDLDDLQQLSVYDIWGSFTHRIAEASERYAVQSIMSARIYQYQEPEDVPADSELPLDVSPQQPTGPIKAFKNGQWVIDWLSIDGGQYRSGSLAVDQFEQLSSAFIDNLADILADKYAVDASRSQQAVATETVTVVNVDTVAKYVDVLRFLNSLGVVKRAVLVEQQGSQATFELGLFGSADNLFNALSLDKNIQRVTDEFGQPLGDAEFIWRK